MQQTKAVAIVPFLGGRRGGGRLDHTRPPVVVVAPADAWVQLSRVGVVVVMVVFGGNLFVWLVCIVCVVGHYIPNCARRTPPSHPHNTQTHIHFNFKVLFYLIIYTHTFYYKVAAALGEHHRGGKYRLASPVECELLFGYAPGAIPPIAHRTPHTRMLLEAGLVCNGEEEEEGEVCVCAFGRRFLVYGYVGGYVDGHYVCGDLSP